MLETVVVAQILRRKISLKPENRRTRSIDGLTYFECQVPLDGALMLRVVRIVVAGRIVEMVPRQTEPVFGHEFGVVGHVERHRGRSGYAYTHGRAGG